MQCGGPAVHRHAMACAVPTRKILFELGHIRTQTKRAVIQRARYSSINIFANGSHLGCQIEVRHGCMHIVRNILCGRDLKSKSALPETRRCGEKAEYAIKYCWTKDQ